MTMQHRIWASAWRLGFVYFVLYHGLTCAVLYRAAILPHGDEAFDPSRFAPGQDSRQAADAIAKAAHDTGWWIRDDSIAKNDTKPSLLFVSSPHGVALSNDFAVYLGVSASGSAVIGATNDPLYTVRMEGIRLNQTRANQMIHLLHHPNVSGFDITDTPLRWGEVIPLLFTKQASRSHLFWTHPLRRFNDSVQMIPELLDIGERLRVWFESLPELVSVLISGDLSHRHRTDGPYGYSNTSRPMDDALGKWATAPCENANELLHTAAGLQNDALSCGFTGFVLLHGIICGKEDAPRTVPEWSSRMLVNRNATYFGMMVAQFERKNATGEALAF